MLLSLACVGLFWPVEVVLSFVVFSVVTDGEDGFAAAVVLVVVVFSLEIFATVTSPEEAFVVTDGWIFSLGAFADAD